MKLKFAALLGVLYFMLFLTEKAIAQKRDTSKNDQVVIFSNNVQQVTSKPIQITARNTIKLSVISFFSGYEEAYYEYVIFHSLSIEGGLGLTFHNYVGDIGYTIGGSGFGNGLDDSAALDGYSDKYENYDHRKVNLGFCLSIAPRVYIENDAPEGFYISPHLQYKQYNFTSQLADTGPTANDVPTFTNGGTFAESRKQTDFTVDFGWQKVYDQISLDFIAGLGLRKINELRNDIGMTTNILGSNNFYNHTLIYNTSDFIALLELRLGYHF